VASSDWWRCRVLYNVYPRSWQDSNGDGIGDIRGIIERLDHLEWLGITGLWLNPIMPSPNHDGGYDVSDYCGILPAFGDLDDFDHLIVEARKRRINVILDIAAAHTSDEHPWFQDASSSRTSRYRDYYVWSPSRHGGRLPTNWISYFGGPAWTFDERSGEYYLHNFSSHQPQLNWWNPEVRSEFDRIFRFWFDRGVAGVRLDAVQALLYDRKLRDNPAATERDTRKEQALGQRFAFSSNRPEVHSIIRHWRSCADSYVPHRLLFGETWVPTTERLAAYYGSGRDELDLAWNLPFLDCSFSTADLATVIQKTLALLPSEATPTWAMSTHDDQGRAALRWCRGDDNAIRCALVLLLGLTGTPILYYGDEIGMIGPSPQTFQGLHDPRDASRTPMHWERGETGGFTSNAVPWLPLGDTSKANVADQRNNASSVLHLCRDLIRLRNNLPAGELTLMPSSHSILAWRRAESLVAANLGDYPAELAADGKIAICTDRSRDGEWVRQKLILQPRQAAFVMSSHPSV
jgi:alpha-glucosidase